MFTNMKLLEFVREHASYRYGNVAFTFMNWNTYYVEIQTSFYITSIELCVATNEMTVFISPCLDRWHGVIKYMFINMSLYTVGNYVFARELKACVDMWHPHSSGYTNKIHFYMPHKQHQQVSLDISECLSVSSVICFQCIQSVEWVSVLSLRPMTRASLPFTAISVYCIVTSDLFHWLP